MEDGSKRERKWRGTSPIGEYCEWREKFFFKIAAAAAVVAVVVAVFFPFHFWRRWIFLKQFENRRFFGKCFLFWKREKKFSKKKVFFSNFRSKTKNSRSEKNIRNPNTPRWTEHRTLNRNSTHRLGHNRIFYQQRNVSSGKEILQREKNFPLFIPMPLL